MLYNTDTYYKNMPTKQVTKPIKKIPFQKLVDAKIDQLEGMSMKKIAKKHQVSAATITDRLERIDAVMDSKLPALSIERQMISEALSDKLRPIKEELSLKSLEIIRAADNIVLDRLIASPDDVTTKDVLRASETHSSRLARITGIEEDPNAGADINTRSKVVNTYVQNIFNTHNKILQAERESVNDTTPTPIEVDETNESE